MKRDPRLRELSVQHHHALVLARTLTQLVEAGQLGEAGRRLALRFEERELFPCCEARLPAAVLEAVEERSRFDA